jgi:hypothetical protein
MENRRFEASKTPRASALPVSAERRPLASARIDALSGAVGAIPIADNGIRLGTLLALYDVEFDLIALFERFVSIQLNCRVVDEYIRPIITSDESVALGVVEPLDLTLELSHRFLPSFSFRTGIRWATKGLSHRYKLRRKKLQKG